MPLLSSATDQIESLAVIRLQLPDLPLLLEGSIDDLVLHGGACKRYSKNSCTFALTVMVTPESSRDDRVLALLGVIVA